MFLRFLVRIGTSADRRCVSGDEEDQTAMVLKFGLKNDRTA